MADATNDPPPQSLADSTATDTGRVTPPNRPWLPEYGMDHTPVVKKAQGHSKFSVDTPEIRQRYRDVAAEAGGHFVSGPSAQAFLEQYMPWNDPTSNDYRRKQPSRYRKNMLISMAGLREPYMYKKYIKALNNWPISSKAKKPAYLSICPKLGEFRDPDTNCGNLAVDIGVYDADNMPEGRITDHSLMDTQTELKSYDNYDAFNDLEDDEPPAKEKDKEGEEGEEEEDDDEDEESEEEEETDEDPRAGEEVPELTQPTSSMRPAFPFENNSVKGCETRGQIACYAAITMMLQYRSHLFTILICGRFARFIRWDRSGAIVSKRFDYTEDPNMIFEYYKRFAQLTPSQRGKDPTVFPIADNDPDAIIARAKFGLYDTDMWHGESGPKAKRDIDIEDQKLFRINMTLNGQARRFVVCAPKFDDGAFSPFGRSTRRSLAIDLDSPDLHDPAKRRGGILFMKDYWREDSPRTAKESDIYGLLAQHKVPYVAEMEAGGDIPDMITITQEHVGGSLSHRFPGDEVYLLPTLQAHRIFLKTVGRDLTTFCSVKGLVTCIADAMEAHQVAFDRACILHRDISVGNIMITPDHRGFLIDWDHCVILNDRSNDKRICRTGTWQFMSAHLLASYGTVHTLVDDRESSLWVLLYVTLRHTRNSFLPTKLHHNLKLWFEDSVIESRGETGGEGKYGVLTGPHKVLPVFDVYGLGQLIRELVDVFAVRYEPELNAEDEDDYEYLASSAPQRAARSKKGMRLSRMEKLNNPTWLCKTLRRHAEGMKVPAKGFDWCKNACYSDDEWRGSSQKRKATTERLDTKRVKGICGTTHRIYFEVADDKEKTQEE